MASRGKNLDDNNTQECSLQTGGRIA